MEKVASQMRLLFDFLVCSSYFTKWHKSGETSFHLQVRATNSHSKMIKNNSKEMNTD